MSEESKGERRINIHTVKTLCKKIQQLVENFLQPLFNMWTIQLLLKTFNNPGCWKFPQLLLNFFQQPLFKINFNNPVVEEISQRL